MLYNIRADLAFGLRNQLLKAVFVDRIAYFEECYITSVQIWIMIYKISFVIAIQKKRVSMRLVFL